MAARKMLPYRGAKLFKFATENGGAVLLIAESFFYWTSGRIWPESPMCFRLVASVIAYAFLSHRYGLFSLLPQYTGPGLGRLRVRARRKPARPGGPVTPPTSAPPSV